MAEHEGRSPIEHRDDEGTKARELFDGRLSITGKKSGFQKMAEYVDWLKETYGDDVPGMIPEGCVVGGFPLDL